MTHLNPSNPSTPSTNPISPTSTPSTSLHLDPQISSTMAQKSLRRIEDKIYQAHHRLEILHQKLLKKQQHNINASRLSGFRETVRSYVCANRAEKESRSLRKSVQIRRICEINGERRVQHKRKVQIIKQIIRAQNKDTYQQIRKQRQDNQRSVRQQRSLQHTRKCQKRDEIMSQQHRRTEYLENFMKNKHLSAKLSKCEDTYAIQAKIKQKQKILEILEKQREQIQMNPQLVGSRGFRGKRGERGERRQGVWVEAKDISNARIGFFKKEKNEGFLD